MVQAKSITGLPGFVWVYQPAHGFTGRHAYNPTTGAALSYRQARYVTSGKVTLSDALKVAQTPLTTERITLRHVTYNVRTFDTLYGAWLYATNANAPTWIAAYGTPYKLYPGEPVETFRSLYGLAEPSGHRRRSIFAYYSRYEELMRGTRVSRAGRRFYVWEQV